jgi:hypothetical protein
MGHAALFWIKLTDRVNQCAKRQLTAILKARRDHLTIQIRFMLVYN